MYIDEIKYLRYGSIIRWINLQKIDNIRLNNSAYIM